MIRIVRSVRISPGRRVRPIRPLLTWELPPGTELALPAGLEAALIREGFASPIREKAAVKTAETGQWD